MHEDCVERIKLKRTIGGKPRSRERHREFPKYRARTLPETKTKIDKTVYAAAVERTKIAFEQCERVICSFSGGKDSTVQLHLAAEEARRIGRTFAVMFIDLEAQYQLTIEHVKQMKELYRDCTEWYWVSLPISLRNAVSMYQPKWKCWDKECEKYWVRQPEKSSITDVNYFPFFKDGMEFEEFVPLFGEWYSNNKRTACLVAIRSDESFNRFRTIISDKKIRLGGRCYTTLVTPNVYNWYSVYDWSTEDIWVYHSKFSSKPYNKLYDLMYKAGLSIHLQRICQPYGDDQRRGLWLYQIIEPKSWAKVVVRVNGVNSGSLYVRESGNINGYGKISLPKGHTWRSFSELLLRSLPRKTQEHFRAKIDVFRKWWMDRGYPKGIPDEVDLKLENSREVPSWRRVCKALLRNDYWCKGLGFSQHRSRSYERYLEMMRKRRKNPEWNLEARERQVQVKG